MANMLNESGLVAFVAVSDLDRAQDFYGNVLGLPVTGVSPDAVVIDANGTMLRLTPVQDKPVVGYTVIGWQVDDIDAVVHVMSDRGVGFNLYEGIDQDAQGIWTTPSGDRVAWFCDSEQNNCSITQFVRS